MHTGDLRSAHAMMTDLIRSADPSAPPLVLSAVDARRRELLVGVDPAAALPAREVEAWVRAQAGDVPVRVEALTFHRHANKQQLNRPIVGGIQITCPQAGGVGSIGVVAQQPNGGERGFVTAGHTVAAPGNLVYQPQQSSVNNWQVGVARTVSPYATAALSDSAFVGLSPLPNPLPDIGMIWKSGTTQYHVADVLGPAVYTVPVIMQGASNATTERSGEIVSVWSTVRFADGAVLYDQIIAGYVSNPGDSGGPVFIPMSDDVHVHLLGINVGFASAGDIDPPPAQGYYGVCSAWECIVDELGPLDVTVQWAAAPAAAVPPALDAIAERQGAGGALTAAAATGRAG